MPAKSFDSGIAPKSRSKLPSTGLGGNGTCTLELSSFPSTGVKSVEQFGRRICSTQVQMPPASAFESKP